MATLGEERYFRNLLLFGEGGMFVLRQLVVKEGRETGKTLKDLLLENRKTSLAQDRIFFEQHRSLYPSEKTANVDLDSWDMSLLILVIRKLFFQRLSPLIKSAVSALKYYRDHFQGHPDSMSLAASKYEFEQKDIIRHLRCLAGHVNNSVPVEECIRKAKSDDIGIGSVIRQIKETKAFNTSFLEKLQQIYLKISSLQKDVTTVKDSVEVIKKEQKKGNKEMKESLTSLQESLDASKLDTASIKESVAVIEKDQKNGNKEIKESLTSLQESFEDSKLDTDSIKESVAVIEKDQKKGNKEIKESVTSLQESLGDLKLDTDSIKERVQTITKNKEELKEGIESVKVSSEDSKLSLATILDKTERLEQTISRLRSMYIRKTRREFTKELKTIIFADCDDDVKKSDAIILLFDLVKILQDPNAFKDEEIEQIISQRVKWYGELTYKLIDDMIKWFGDINQQCDGTGSPRSGSIHLPIFCSNVTCLFTVLGYINGKQCKQRLSSISSTITKIFDTSCTLVWKVDPTSIQSVMSSLMDDIGTDDSTKGMKKLMLPIHATDMKGLANAWKMFGGEDRDHHLEEISGTLSKMFGETIHLKTSVDKNQLLEAVKEIVDDKEWNRPYVDDRKRQPGSALKETGDTPKVVEKEWKFPYVGDHKSQIDSALKEKDDNPIGSDLIIERKQVHELPLGIFRPFDEFIMARIIVTTDHKLLIASRWRPAIFELDKSFNVTKSIDLPDIPSDMCYIGEKQSEVAVSFVRFPEIALVSKVGDIINVHTHTNRCISITYQNNQLYLLDVHGVVHSYDEKWNNISKITVIDEIDLDITFPLLPKIAVSTNGEMIYVCNNSDLITVYKGNIQSKLHLEYQMKDICVMGDGTILVCSMDSHDLLRVDQYGEKVLGKTLIPQIEGCAYTMCYDKAKSELLIVDLAGNIHVYDIRTKKTT